MPDGYAGIARLVTGTVEKGLASTGDAWFVYNRRFRIDVHPLRAEVAELADAQASGACYRKVVEVQILSSAPLKYL